jgi:hypothetical protein
MESYRSCGQNAWVYESVDDPGLYKIRADYCKDRWCVPCQVARAHTIRRNIAPLLKGSPTRFLTLTIKSNSDCLKDRIDYLLRCYKTLRKQGIWTANVTGGASVVEVTRNAESGHYHVHLHALLKGNYIPKRTLQSVWHRITGDSYIIDLQMIRDDKQAAGYLAKYVAKPIHKSILADPDALVEAIIALKGRRLITTLGDWRGTKLLKSDTDGDWRPIDTLARLRESAKTGAAAALQIICTLMESQSWQQAANPLDLEGPAP